MKLTAWSYSLYIRRAIRGGNRKSPGWFAAVGHRYLQSPDDIYYFAGVLGFRVQGGSG